MGNPSFGSKFQNKDNESNNEKPGIICFKCQQPGHFATQCPKSGNAPTNFNMGNPSFGSRFQNLNTENDSNNEKPGIICFKCQQPGHFAPKCPSNKNGGKSNFSLDAGQKSKGNQKRKFDDYENGGGTQKNQKKCSSCGHVGRHLKNSNCPLMKRKKIKINDNESGFNYNDYGGEENNE